MKNLIIAWMIVASFCCGLMFYHKVTTIIQEPKQCLYDFGYHVTVSDTKISVEQLKRIISANMVHGILVNFTVSHSYIYGDVGKTLTVRYGCNISFTNNTFEVNGTFLLIK